MSDRLRDALLILKLSQPNLEWLVLAALWAAVSTVGFNVRMHQLKNSMPEGTRGGNNAVKVFADPYFYGPMDIL